MVHLSYNHNIDNLQRVNIENNMCDQSLESLPGVYTNLQSASKKRKLSQDSPLVKSEPGEIFMIEMDSPLLYDILVLPRCLLERWSNLFLAKIFFGKVVSFQAYFFL